MAFSWGWSTPPGSVADMLCHVFGSVSMTFSISLSFSVLKFKFIIWIFVLHCPCCLTMCKNEALLLFCCCLKLFQFVCSCYSGDNGRCRLYSMVEVLRIGWLLVSWKLFEAWKAFLLTGTLFFTSADKVKLMLFQDDCVISVYNIRDN